MEVAERRFALAAMHEEVVDFTYSSDTSYSPSPSPLSNSSDEAALPSFNAGIVVVTDGEEEAPPPPNPPLNATEARRQRMEEARTALRRAAAAGPRPPPPTNVLLSTFRCSICLSPPTNLSVTSCGHMFCGRCLYDALAVQMRQDGHEWSDTDWLGAMGEPGAGRIPRRTNLFTPFGSSGALALATAAGISASPARELFSELVSQRQASGQAQEETAPATQRAHATAPIPASRLRANNGTGRLRGHCPVCRTPVHGGFTGTARRGILGLEIMLGTPAAEPQPLTIALDDRVPYTDRADDNPAKRTRVV